MPSKRQNIRVKKLIISEILNNRCVEIYVFINDESVKYKGYIVNLAAGLENILIETFSPEWNIQSKKKLVEPITEESLSAQNKPLIKPIKTMDIINPVCEVTLHKSYYGTSFFNIPVSHSTYLSMDSKSPVEVIFGNDLKTKLIALNDRTAAKSEAPRIRIGKEFANWTLNNFRLKDKMKVEFISKNEIRLSKSITLV